MAKVAEFLGMKVNYPIEVYVDNIGATFCQKPQRQIIAQNMWIQDTTLFANTLRREH